MSDITKCGDKQCPSREQCWRWLAPGLAHQSMADFNRADNALKCSDGFWPKTERQFFVKGKSA